MPPPVSTPLARATPAQDGALAAQSPDDLVPVLVARVFEDAPAAMRGHLLEQLLKPLGLLSLAAVANGLFARITLGSGGAGREVKVEDASLVNPADVIALVHHVQQVSVQAVESLSKIISSSPVLAGSAAAAMLLTLLAKQARNRLPVQGNDFDPVP